jgi:hypothetical protein
VRNLSSPGFEPGEANEDIAREKMRVTRSPNYATFTLYTLADWARWLLDGLASSFVIYYFIKNI